MLTWPRAALMATGAVLIGPSLWGQSVPEPIFAAWQMEGGSGDDHVFARLAAGLQPGTPLDEATLVKTRLAIEATDRFRRVQLSVVLSPEGARLHCLLDPWPRVERIHMEGLPKGFSRLLPSDLRPGAVAGPRRLAEASASMAATLRDAGFPDATVHLGRGEGDRDLVVKVVPGEPLTIRNLRFEGSLGNYKESTIRRLVGATLGSTRWRDLFRLEAESRLRRRFVKDNHLEGHADLAYRREDGVVVVRLMIGPKVRLRIEGQGASLGGVRKTLPLVQADRYSADLLSEGGRRILRFLHAKGHLDAKDVDARREVTRGTPEAPEEVTITYTIQPGPAYVLDDVQIERNQDVDTETLIAEAGIPSGRLWVGKPRATLDLLNTIQDKLQASYQRRGYTEVVVRQAPLQRMGSRIIATYQIREGTQHLLRHVVLDVPERAFPASAPLRLAAALPTCYMDNPERAPILPKRWSSDRPDSQVAAQLQEAPQPEPGLRRFVLTFDQPQPLVRGDLARTLSALRERMLEEGIMRPDMRLHFEPYQDAPAANILLAESPRHQFRRLVVQGADRTRARAIERENLLVPGAPLDPSMQTQTQTGLASLGGFTQVDLNALGDREPGSWEEGDLKLSLQERSPWVFTQAFGYDKSQGYHIGLGAQRLNLWGMGRTLDFGVRAGDGTLDNPFLRKVFPTGPSPRSVDMYSLAYSDPFFDALGGLLPDRTVYRLEGAYILEQRETFQVRRRRVLNSFEWKPQGVGIWQIQVGLRNERVAVKSAIEGIQDEELNKLVGTQDQVTISAPWFQVFRDRRDNPMDPTRGTLFRGRVELANQLWGTSPNSSFVKVDVTQQWHWPLGLHASSGVASLTFRLGAARPTASTARELPLSERFFAGGPFTHRGVEPDWLGPQGTLPVRETFPPYNPRLTPDGNPMTKAVPLGGQGLFLVNAEVRFPLYKRFVWGEVFLDSGQVYASLFDVSGRARFPHPRTALGTGLILKVGIPLKIEFAWDVRRLRGVPREPEEEATRLKHLLVSAGFQF